MVTRRKIIELKSTNLLDILNSLYKSYVWKKEFVRFVNSKNHSPIFTKVKKESLGFLLIANLANWSKIGSITKIINPFAMQNIKDGLEKIEITSIRRDVHPIKKILKFTNNEQKNTEEKLVMLLLKNTKKSIIKNLRLIDMLSWPSNLVILFGQFIVNYVMLLANRKDITKIIPNLCKFNGSVLDAMVFSIELILLHYQRERLSLETPKGDAIVQTIEETYGEKSEAIFPPLLRSVRQLWRKVIEWLRHTAGCSFYQGSCITNDLWMQNLRSSGI